MADIPLTETTIDGLKISHAVAGEPDAPPIILLHGWGAEISLVWPLAEGLMRAGFRVYALDLPGFGQSDPPPMAWGVRDYADLVLHYAEAHDISRFYLFGHSFGGRIGLMLGAEQTECLHKMVLANSAGLRSQPSPLKQARLKAYKAVRDGLKTIGLRGLSDGLRGWYNRRYGSADFQQVSGVMRETFVKVISQDLAPYAERVGVPTLLLWGDQDADTPLAQGKTLEALIPDAGLVIYEGAGHYSYLERLIDAVQVTGFFFRQN